MDFFRLYQLAGLGLFLGLASYRAIHLRVRHGIASIVPGRQSRLAFAAFVITWCWALLVVWYVLPGGGRLLVAPLDAPCWRWFPLRVLGAVLIGAGLLLNVLAHHRLGDNWRLGIDERPGGTLVTTGVYGHSRHPIYLFFNLYLAGTMLVEGRPLLLLFWLANGAVLHFEARREEEFLGRRFGAAYAEYRARVRRYWGRRKPA